MKGKNPRLQFTESELEDSRLKEHIRRADKAADKAEAARAKIPKKKKKVRQRTVDPATGKKTVRLHFEEVDKPAPASKLNHAARAAPGQAVKGFAGDVDVNFVPIRRVTGRGCNAIRNHIVHGCLPRFLFSNVYTMVSSADTACSSASREI